MYVCPLVTKKDQRLERDNLVESEKEKLEENVKNARNSIFRVIMEQMIKDLVALSNG